MVWHLKKSKTSGFLLLSSEAAKSCLKDVWLLLLIKITEEIENLVRLVCIIEREREQMKMRFKLIDFLIFFV